MTEKTLFGILGISEERAEQIQSEIIIPLLMKSAIEGMCMADGILKISKRALSENEKLLAASVYCTNYQTLAIQKLNPECILP